MYKGQKSIWQVWHRYPTPWYVPSDMWGSHIESKLKVKVLAKTGETDPDFLK